MTNPPRQEDADPAVDPAVDDLVSDDAIIGRAFRWSLLVFLIVGGLIAAVLFPGGREDAPEAFVDAPVAVPVENRQAADATPPAVRFTDISITNGVDFIHTNGAYGDRFLPETMGSGAAFFDYDNDGDADLLLVNASRWPWRNEAAAGATTRLYANRGNGFFDDVSESVGLDLNLYGTGVAVADYDGDGYQDVYVTAVGLNVLLHNDNGERFVVRDLGVAGAADDWSTAALFLDYDNDDDLDLFVANYVKWSREIDFDVDYQLTGVGRAYGPPTNYEGTDNRLFRNDGDRFVEQSEQAGIRVANPATGKPMGKGLAATILDVDGNGLVDIMVANDTVQNFLFVNQGGGRFEENGALFGIAFDNSGAATGAMGIDAARHANDADVGIAVGNFANEMTSFYVAQAGSGLFSDASIVSGIGAPSRRALSFGLFFFDYDLDGWLDLLQVNGHVENEINSVQPSQHYEQPAQLFWNCASRCRNQYTLLPADRVGDLAAPAVGRGASYADIDADGDLDVVITQPGREARLLRNDQDLKHHWLRVRLLQPGGNRDAIGASLKISAGDSTQYRYLTPAKSYLSHVELPLTIGLGKATSADVEVTWPDGQVEAFTGLAADRAHLLERH